MYRKRKKPVSLVVWIAQIFGLGTIKWAPGTIAVLPGLIFTLLLIELGSFTLYLIVATITLLIAIPIAHFAESEIGYRDPPSIIIDEVVALPFCFVWWLWYTTDGNPSQWISLSWLMESNHITMLLIHIILFRIFDIWKPWPVKQAQALWGGFGIIIDDMVAALLVNVSCFLFTLLFKL